MDAILTLRAGIRQPIGRRRPQSFTPNPAPKSEPAVRAPKARKETVGRTHDHHGQGCIDGRDLRQPAPECRACAFFGRCRNYCACANRQSTGNAGKPSAFLCEHERTLIPIADRAGATLCKERNPLFIDRIYNPAHALVSYVEERVSAT